jgi:hypothetical protein
MINRTDTALLPFLNSFIKTESEDLLADLLTARIQPTIEKALRSKLHVSLKPTDFSRTEKSSRSAIPEVWFA